MKVELISHTEFPEEICSIAGQTCYSSDDPGSITPKTITLKNIIESGHDSVLEHAVFTFAISDISRVCSHQLVRHRMASYSQQSQRYVKISKAGFIVPPTIIENQYENGEAIDNALRECIANCAGMYDELVELGIPEEDARYILPQCVTTNIVVTMNARELRHFFALRCCNRAQWEIRQLANSMLYICKEVSPIIFKDAGPGCVRGKCPEGSKSCKKVKE